jgi:tetratricopeptide (TPR) repeat protein
VRRLACLSLPLTLALVGCPDRPLEVAKSLAAQGQHAEAGARFLEVAKADPADLAAWDGAVEAFCHRLHDVGRCMETLDLELELLGNLQRHRDALSEALERRARDRIAQGMVDAGLADLDRAEKAAPERAAVQVVRARALIMRGERAAALAALERARKLDPEDPEVDEVLRLVPSLPADDPGAPTEGFGGD